MNRLEHLVLTKSQTGAADDIDDAHCLRGGYYGCDDGYGSNWSYCIGNQNLVMAWLMMH